MFRSVYKSKQKFIGSKDDKQYISVKAMIFILVRILLHCVVLYVCFRSEVSHMNTEQFT